MAAFSEEQEFQRNLELLDLVTLGQVRRRSGQANYIKRIRKKPIGNSTQLKHFERDVFPLQDIGMLVVP
jgi:hypothetical protein